MDKKRALIVLTTVADEASASRIAEAVVAAGLAACVTQLPGVVSTYRWQDKMQQDTEILMLIKTTKGAYAALSQEIERLHDYELPELLAVDVDEGSDSYLSWLASAVNTKE